MKTLSPNTEAQKATLCWYADSGHGWLVVDAIEFIQVLEFASSYSYVDNNQAVVYLEEDEDAPKFIKHYEINVAGLPEHYIDGESEIRNLPTGKATS